MKESNVKTPRRSNAKKSKNNPGDPASLRPGVNSAYEDVPGAYIRVDPCKSVAEMKPRITQIDTNKKLRRVLSGVPAAAGCHSHKSVAEMQPRINTNKKLRRVLSGGPAAAGCHSHKSVAEMQPRINTN